MPAYAHEKTSLAVPTRPLQTRGPAFLAASFWLTKSAGEPSEKEVIDFFMEHPNPEDSVLHQWAESHGWSPHKVEEIVYRLATREARFETGGKSGKPGGMTAAKADPEQMRIGAKVEQEHTPDLIGARKVVLDHLTEDPYYYAHAMPKDWGKKEAEMVPVFAAMLQSLEQA